MGGHSISVFVFRFRPTSVVIAATTRLHQLASTNHCSGARCSGAVCRRIVWRCRPRRRRENTVGDQCSYDSSQPHWCPLCHSVSLYHHCLRCVQWFSLLGFFGHQQQTNQMRNRRTVRWLWIDADRGFSCHLGNFSLRRWLGTWNRELVRGMGDRRSCVHGTLRFLGLSRGAWR